MIEFVAGLGIVAYGVLAFTLGTRYLKVVDHTTGHHDEAEVEAELTPGVLPVSGD